MHAGGDVVVGMDVGETADEPLHRPEEHLHLQLGATAGVGEITGDTVTGGYEEAQQVLDALEGLGISYTEVTAQLEREGVEKFEKAWAELLDGVSAELAKAAK